MNSTGFLGDICKQNLTKIGAYPNNDLKKKKNHQHEALVIPRWATIDHFEVNHKYSSLFFYEKSRTS